MGQGDSPIFLLEERCDSPIKMTFINILTLESFPLYNIYFSWSVREGSGSLFG